MKTFETDVVVVGAGPSGLAASVQAAEDGAKVIVLNKADVVGKKKNKEVVNPRQIAIYLINEFMNIPLAAIGEYFGGREHTTVMHARDKISAQIATDAKTKTAVNDIKAMILRK